MVVSLLRGRTALRVNFTTQEFFGPDLSTDPEAGTRLGPVKGPGGGFCSGDTHLRPRTFLQLKRASCTLARNSNAAKAAC